MALSLMDLSVGDKATVIGYHGHEQAMYRQSLLVMGLIPGSEFTVVRRAPLGDPIQLQIRQSKITLRQNESQILQVEIQHEGQHCCSGRQSECG